MPELPGNPGRWPRMLASGLGHVRAWLAEDAMLGEGLPRAFVLFLVCFGLGMIVISLVGDQGLIAYLRLRGESVQLSGRIEALRQREVRLHQEIEALQNDPDYIERVARKQLGLVKPGEVVILLPGRLNSQWSDGETP